MAVVLGVDSSTQSTKVEARDVASGEVLATGSAPHPSTMPPVSEQDPEAWWTALVAAVSQLGEIRRDVVAISVAGQQHGLVLVDDTGHVVRPAKLWNDTTSADCAQELVAELGAARWAAGCGSVPVASFTITKLAWIARHEPASLAATAKIMLPHDWLTWRLSGEHITDRGDASGTGWFDPVSGSYVAELLGAAVPGDPLEWIGRLPRVAEPSAAVGELTGPAAEELGLGIGVVVGPGTGDNMGAALGLGLDAGDVVISLGTSGTVYSVSATPTGDETGAVAGFASASGAFLPLVCTLNATGVTDTVAQWMGTDAAGLSDLAQDAPLGTVGPVLVPYFDGERTPNLPDASGTWAGLRRSTTRTERARAAHDGVLCGLLDGLDRLAACGVDTGGTLRLVGGGAKSSAYRQRCADLTGRAVVVPDADQAVAAGAALQAAAAWGSGSFDQLARDWKLGAGATVEPLDPGAGAVRDAYAAAAAALID